MARGCGVNIPRTINPLALIQDFRARDCRNRLDALMNAQSFDGGDHFLGAYVHDQLCPHRVDRLLHGLAKAHERLGEDGFGGSPDALALKAVGKELAEVAGKLR